MLTHPLRDHTELETVTGDAYCLPLGRVAIKLKLFSVWQSTPRHWCRFKLAFLLWKCDEGKGGPALLKQYPNEPQS